MYQALYRKYRPQTFDDVVGQGSITQVLRTQLITGKLSHAYLFTGSRGTGKTTCSKILAKAVNCLNPVDGNPCNCCSACRSIDDGSCMDVLEIDAASNNGVDNVRGLREDAIYAPAEVKMRVYIIDEVHMLSPAAFNALLKIIEEPPPHLLFILATTELHKVPVTILSRCQRFAFRRITPEDVAHRISYVAYEEGIEIEPEAAALLGRLADGALRDGLSLLDQCAAGVEGTLRTEDIYRCLGIAGARQAADLLRTAATHDTKTALTILGSQYSEGKDLAALLDELISLCRDLLVLKTAPGCAASMITGVCTDAEMKGLLPLFRTEELLRITELLQKTAADFQRSSNRRIDVELCLIRMCDPALDLDAASLSARIARLEETIASGSLVVRSEPPASARPAPAAPVQPKQPEARPKKAAAPVSDELPEGFWAELVSRVKTELLGSVGGYFKVSERSMLQPALQGDTLLLLCASDFVKTAVDDDKTRQILSQSASAILHRPIQVSFQVRKAGISADDPLNEFMRRGREHPGIFHVKEDKKTD